MHAIAATRDSNAPTTPSRIARPAGIATSFVIGSTAALAKLTRPINIQQLQSQRKKLSASFALLRITSSFETRQIPNGTIAGTNAALNKTAP